MLTYGLAVSSPRTKGGWIGLERMHRLGLRFCCNNFKDSYSELLERLNFESVSRLCFERRCALIYRCVHRFRFCLAAEQLITVQLPGHDLQLIVLQHRHQLSSNIRIYHASATWNALSFSSQETTSAILNSGYHTFIRVISEDAHYQSSVQSCPLLYPVFMTL